MECQGLFSLKSRKTNLDILSAAVAIGTMKAKLGLLQFSVCASVVSYVVFFVCLFFFCFCFFVIVCFSLIEYSGYLVPVSIVNLSKRGFCCCCCCCLFCCCCCCCCCFLFVCLFVCLLFFFLLLFFFCSFF